MSEFWHIVLWSGVGAFFFGVPASYFSFRMGYHRGFRDGHRWPR